jgi:predicted ATP-grasp superfamily ATP-dependent carboligase
VIQRTVIVTDGEQRAALAVVRSLGAAGYRCIVTSSTGASMAGGSRFVARTATVPDALTQPRDFAEAIVYLAADQEASLVIPIAEPAMLAILAVRERLAPAIVPFPDLLSFQAISDKQRLLAEASALGIAIPVQTVLSNAAALESLDLSSLPYPIVIKPARSIGEHAGARAKLAVAHAGNVEELTRKIRSLPPAAFPVLLQQRVVGPGTGIFLLLWDGEQRAQFAHKRLCEKPPSGGVSVYRESIPIDEELRDRSRELLQRFGWHGVAMVEYKRELATGRPYLMEVNGRFWGSVQLAIDAGVDFPRLLAASALRERIAPVTTYRLGVRSRWWWGQIDHLISRVRRSSALPPGTRSATRALGDLILGPFRSENYEEVMRWSDPRPFFRETIRWIGAR